MKLIKWAAVAILATSCGAITQSEHVATDSQVLGGSGKKNEAREQRFERYLNRIETLIASVHSEAEFLEMVDKTREVDFRGATYRLEALLKVYRKATGDRGRKIYDDVKAFEDFIGQYGETREALQFAIEVKAPPQLIAFLKQNKAAKGHELVVFMQREGWVGKKLAKAKTRLIREELEKLDWPKESDDSDYFRDRLVKEYSDLLEKDLVRTRRNNSLAAIHEQLENWTHELRRSYRWPGLMANASDGLVVRDDQRCSLPRYAPLVRGPLGQMPFVQLPRNPNIKHPIVIESCLFLAFSEKVGQLGQIKDRGLGTIHLAHGFMESGIERNPDRALAKAIGLSRIDFERDVFAKTAELENEIRSQRVIEATIQNLKKKK